MENDSLAIEEMIKKAKDAFKKYAKTHQNKLTFQEFEIFINDFYANSEEDKKMVEKLDIKQLFNEFKNSQSDSLNEKEFEEAWKDLTISRMKTKENF